MAVVLIPEGKTADETFVMWFRANKMSSYLKDKMDQIILEEALFTWQELDIQTVT